MNADLAAQCLEAEQMVLGRLLVENAARYRIALRPDDFARQDHRELFVEMLALIDEGKPCDATTLIARLRDGGSLGMVGGAAYVHTLAMDCGYSSAIEAHAAIVREQADRRRLLLVCREVLAQPLAAVEIARRLAGALDDLNAREAASARSVAQVMELATDAAEARHAAQLAGAELGPRSGLPTVDEWMGPLQRGCLYICAARPGVGKTAFLSQLALHSAQRGFAGFIASLEMSEQQLGSRAVAQLSGATASGLLRGHAEDIRRARTYLAMNTQALHALPLHIDTQTVDLHGIVARLYEAKRRWNIAFAAVDHIGLVQGARRSTRNDELGEITGTLKRTAKRLDIAIIGLSQLSRSNEKEHRRPQLADLRDSGNIEQDADLVIFLHAPKDGTDSATSYAREVGLFKNRDGREGWVGMPKREMDVRFNGRTQTFYEVVVGDVDTGGGERREMAA